MTYLLASKLCCRHINIFQNYPFTDVGIILTAATKALDGKGS